MQRHTEAYVLNVLWSGKQVPSRLNRRLFPTRHDYANIMYRWRLKHAHSRIDSENLLHKLGTMSVSRPGDFAFFRSCSDASDTTSVEDEMGNVSMAMKDKSGLLLVYQTEWQKRLLAKYGGLCLLDATYKTTRYAVPLFFLCVKTNVNYIVVATFITQFEDTSSIAEALQMINQVNPNWSPQCFVTDFCEAEINAIEHVFNG